MLDAEKIVINGIEYNLIVNINMVSSTEKGHAWPGQIKGSDYVMNMDLSVQHMARPEAATDKNVGGQIAWHTLAHETFHMTEHIGRANGRGAIDPLNLGTSRSFDKNVQALGGVQDFEARAVRGANLVSKQVGGSESTHYPKKDGSPGSDPVRN